MEEEPTSSVVTRLRRRLSTDPEESISPATPTKKKNSRLAVKPQLENIDELAIISPRKSRRSVVKEGAEVIDGNPSTPSRRNSRARSLTSNISMYECNESPRAKRAARRHSQTGSDNEVYITPRSRRTRKNSVTSLESQDENYVSKVVKVNTINEELGGQKLSESNKELDFSEIDSSVPKIRRSPRLNAKKNIQNTNLDKVSIEDDKLSINIENEKKEDHLNTETDLCSNTENEVQNIAVDGSTDSKKNMDISKNASFSDSVLVSKMDNKPNIKYALRKNKSLSFGEDIKTNRSRSRSFSNLSKNGLESDSIQKLEFFSDNEKRRKNILKSNEKLLKCNNFEIKLNNIDKNECENHETNLSLDNKNHSAKNENSIDFSVKFKRSSAVIEDFDSDCFQRSIKNAKRNSITEADDQCVPVVDQHLNNENKQDSNLSSSNKEIIVSIEEKDTGNDCEPMDVDETFPQNITLISNKTEEIENLNMSKQNKSISNLNHSGSCNNSNKKSMTEVDIDLHDIRADEYNALSQNPNATAKSLDVSDSQLNKKENQADHDQTLVADTPLKQNQIKKIGITTSTPVNISSSSKIYKKNNQTLISKPKTTSETNDTSSEVSDRNDFLDEEVEDAGVAYESGDSRDDEERCYEDDHEILDEGVTLTSESNISDDSDYEKDSFLVSSDEQDYELLNGSGDDLGHSDNELTMSVQSKTKYNTRKMKETKIASREMYQARHKIKTDSSIKDLKKENKKRVPLLKYSESTDESESEQLQTKPNMKKSGRIDSSSENSNSINNEDAKASEMLKDDGDTIIDEKELTMDYNENETLTKDPLSGSTVVKEELKSFSNDTSMSTVNFTTLENMAQVDVEQDISMLETDATTDPLDESDNDSGSSISENESVVQGYENMLNNLNEVYPTQQMKTKNLSLDLEARKSSEEEKCINDNLNLTVSKSPTKTLSDKSEKNIEDKTEVCDEANNTTTLNKREKKKSSVITESPKSTIPHNDSIEISTRKKKKKLSVDNVVLDSSTNTKSGPLETHCDPIENLEVSDTYLGETESSRSEYNDVKEKKRKEKKKQIVDNTENIVTEVDASNNSSDVTTKNVSNSVNETESTEENYTEKTEKNMKKKKKHSMDNVEGILAEVNVVNVLESNKLSEGENTSNLNKTELSEENYTDSTEKTAKKKKKKHLAENIENTMTEINSTNVLTSNKYSNETAKENTSDIGIRDTESSENIYMDITKDIVKKKKKKHSADDIDNKLAEDATNYLSSNTSFDVAGKGNISNSAKETESSDNNHIDITEESVKKKKKKHSTKSIESSVEETNVINVFTTKHLLGLKTIEDKSNINVKQTESSEDGSPDNTEKSVKLKKLKKKKHSTDKVETVPEVNAMSALTSNRSSDITTKERTSNNLKETESLEDNVPHVDLLKKDKKKKKRQFENADNENIETDIKSILNAERDTDSNRRDIFTELIEDNLPSVDTTVNNIKKKRKRKSGDTENIMTEEKLIAAHVLAPKLPYEGSSGDHNKKFSDEQLKKNKKKRDNTDNLPTLTIQQLISNESSVSEDEDLHVLKKSKCKHSNNSDNLKDEIEYGDINPIFEELDLCSEYKKIKFSNSSTPSCNELGFKIMRKQNTISSTSDPKEKQNISKSLSVNQSSLMPIGNLNEDHGKVKDSLQKINKKSKKIKRMEDNQKDADRKDEDVIPNTLMKKPKEFMQITENAVNSERATKRMKKRKMRDEDDLTDVTSVKNSENIFSHITVPRLPATVIQQLEEKPLPKEPRITECPIAISTSSFLVEKTKSYKAKPSQYLEQSVRIESPSPKPKKKKPKLIDIAPAPSSSICGFTTTFKVNVMPKETQFVAQSLNMANYKREQLYKKNIKRQGTYELYKKQRKIKLSKF